MVLASGDQRHCAYTATKFNGQIGYSVRVGGGLSNEPHLAVRLDAFVLPEQAARVARATTEIFREQQNLRENRDQARMKYLFIKEGWTAESFLDELQSRLDFTLLPARRRLCPTTSSRSRGRSQATPGGLQLCGSIGAARPLERRSI